MSESGDYFYAQWFAANEKLNDLQSTLKLLREQQREDFDRAESLQSRLALATEALREIKKISVCMNCDEFHNHSKDPCGSEIANRCLEELGEK